jgi:hypothetical protein
VANKSAVYVVLALLLVGGGGFFWLSRQPIPVKAIPVATPEAKAYIKNLKLAKVEMKATESYVGAAVVEILGEITNNGDRELKQVDLTCVFYDPYGQVLSREPSSIVRPNAGGLKPGETKQFRLPFDNAPQGWNQRLPQLVIGQIIF